MLNPSNIKNWEEISLFKDIKEEDFQKILDHSSIKEYRTNQTITIDEEDSGLIYIILKGSLRTICIDKEGDETTLKLFQPNEICLDANIFNEDPSLINIQSTTASKILVISNDFIKSYLHENLQLTLNLLDITTEHYKNSLHQVNAINIKSPIQRVGYYLLLKYLEAGNNKELEFEVPFKKQIIASHLNMTPETFSRALKHLKTIGIDVKNEKVTISSRQDLCNFCDNNIIKKCKKHEGGECYTSQLMAAASKDSA